MTLGLVFDWSQHSSENGASQRMQTYLQDKAFSCDVVSSCRHFPVISHMTFTVQVIGRAVTVADFYHRGGNNPTTAGGAVLCIFIYIILKRKNK